MNTESEMEQMIAEGKISVAHYNIARSGNSSAGGHLVAERC